MSLSEEIKEYFFENFEEIKDNKFHFLSRLYLWNQDPKSYEYLQAFKADYFVPKIKDKLYSRIQNSTDSKKKVEVLRAPYFKKYDQLIFINRVIFHLLFAKNIFGNDLRDMLYGFYDKQTLDSLEKDLLADRQAIAMLSTHAINFIYLYNKFIKQNENIDVNLFYEIGQTGYDLKDKTQMKYLIYLYTHCIIGESLFYFRNITGDTKQVYIKMLQYLEYLISNYYFLICLDNKFEFLVCCKIMNYQTSLKNIIESEAGVSIADNGKYIVDRCNLNPQSKGFNTSEHRNVLYILSNAEYKPLFK